uniref:Envelope glycoprotein n=1 Tax=Zaire ebolavirus TaxID=186538 RepID=A0A5J6EDK7_9MONO|nr:spike glycoprotein GP [Zaire ebolavirus]
MGVTGILQLPRDRFKRTSFFLWVIILFQRTFSIPLGVIHNSTLQVSDVDKLVCRDKLSSTNQLRPVGLNLEGNGVATDVPSATKRWGFRSGVPPKVVNYEAGEWAENCYNLEIKKPDGSECLPAAPDGIRGFPRCRYVHKVSGTGPCAGDFAFHKEGAFFLYDRLASTVIYRGTTFAEGVVAFLILPQAKKDFFSSHPLREPVNATEDPSSGYYSTTIRYQATGFGTNETEYLFEVDNLTYVQLEPRFTPQFLLQLNETIYASGKRSNTTGKLIWKVNPEIDTTIGEWAFWETKKNLTRKIRSEELSFTAVSNGPKNISGQSPARTSSDPETNTTNEDHKIMASENSSAMVQVHSQGRKAAVSHLTTLATISTSPQPPTTKTGPDNSTHNTPVYKLDISEATQVGQHHRRADNDSTASDTPPATTAAGPLKAENTNTSKSADSLDLATTTSPQNYSETAGNNNTHHQDTGEESASSGKLGLITNTIAGVAGLITGGRRTRREVIVNAQPKCNPNLHYWTTQDEGAAIGLAWIPYFGPAAEGIYTEGLMHNQNGLICGLRQLANETTQALQLFLRATTELRTFSILNRKAIDFLLQRWGGTCHILGPDCCIEPHDWTKNITDKIDQIIHDFVDKTLPDQGDNDNWWTGWRQWIPAGIGVTGVIIAVIALFCICKFVF